MKFLRNSAAFGGLLAGLLFANIARADTLPKCQFDPQLGKLSEAEAKSDGSLEAVRAELGLRRAILKNVLDCSIAETLALKTGVTAAGTDSPDIAALEARFAEKLDEIVGYYNLQKAKLGDVGIQGSKEMARNISEKRATAFSPLTQEAAQFLIWTKNQELFRAARRRLMEIENTVRVLHAIDNQETTGSLANAEQALQTAESLNQQAKQSLQNFDASDDSLALIKNSLDALSQTYQAFFEVSQAVSGLEPQ